MSLAELESQRTTAPQGTTRPHSAKGLLLVLLGEFVWPHPSPVWASVLLDALAELDVEPDAARKAIHRTHRSELIEPQREGRRVRWSLTPRAHEILSSGYDRTYGWDSRDQSWDGQWLLLSVTIPDAQRNVRHHLQTRLGWAGLGSPTPGQWLTPHAERRDEVAKVVTDLGLAEYSHCLVGTIGPLGDERRLVAAAWDLNSLAQDYTSFIAAYQAERPSSDRECFRARIAMVQDWRHFPYTDPDLPKRFLPDDWPGFEAARLFRERYNAWNARSTRHWRRVLDSARS